MKVTLDLSEHTVLGILQQAEDDVSFEVSVNELLAEALAQRAASANQESVDDIVQAMLAYAIDKCNSKPITTQLLYQSALNKPWTDMPPSRRKSIGRRFSMLVAERQASAMVRVPVVRLYGKTQANAAMYHVVLQGLEPSMNVSEDTKLFQLEG